VDPKGRLIIAVNNRVERIFQQVSFTGHGPIVLAVTWKGMEVYINGRALLEHPAPPVVFEPGPNLMKPPDGPYFLTLDPTETSNQVERFFMQTLIDLDRKVESGTDYELTRAGGLLRQLIADAGKSLFVLVNRTYALKPRFVVSHEPNPEDYPLTATRWLPIDPRLGPKREVGLDGFLRLPVLAGATNATVLDLIKACANSKGGVHLGPAESDGQTALLTLEKDFQTKALDETLLSIAQVARVTMRAMVPLTIAIGEAWWARTSQRTSSQ
jgi:hypothetical protein